MLQKRVEVCVVELQMCMGRPDIPACIRFQPAKQRGDKHDLMRAQMSYIGACKMLHFALASRALVCTAVRSNEQAARGRAEEHEARGPLVDASGHGGELDDEAEVRGGLLRGMDGKHQRFISLQLSDS